MTAYTAAEYEELRKAIAEGALRVQYQDRSVTYRSLDEMRSLLREMEQSLGLNPTATGQYRMSYNRGL